MNIMVLIMINPVCCTVLYNCTSTQCTNVHSIHRYYLNPKAMYKIVHSMPNAIALLADYRRYDVRKKIIFFLLFNLSLSQNWAFMYTVLM